jgi:hypothetical protein
LRGICREIAGFAEQLGAEVLNSGFVKTILEALQVCRELGSVASVEDRHVERG